MSLAQSKTENRRLPACPVGTTGSQKVWVSLHHIMKLQQAAGATDHTSGANPGH